MRKLYTILLLTGIIIAQQGVEEIPNTMSFQALLADAEGNIYADGEYSITFRILHAFGGQELTMWGQEHMVNVSNGLFSVVLSDLPYTIPEDAELEIQVGNDVLSPRHSFTSVPFAFNSHLALHANHSTYSDTAYYVMNASIPDTAHFSHQSRHSNHADSSGFAHQSQHAQHADTAHFVMTAPMSDTAHYAAHAGNADTANYVNLSSYNGSIGVIKDDDAKVTIFSSDDNSSSYLTLISQTSTGVQRELRVINEGNVGGGFRFYDATNGDDLMVIDTSGKMGLGVSSPSEKLEISDGNIALDNDCLLYTSPSPRDRG